MHFNPVITLAVLGVLTSVNAHTIVTNIHVDGVDQGNQVCIRRNMNAPESNYPVMDVMSNDMACGFDGGMAVPKVCPVKAGSKMTFEYHHTSSKPDDPTIAPSHKGPCAIYMKKVGSASANNNAAGNGWFKIFEDSSADASGNSWCTIKLNANDGMLDFTIPSDIQSGDYLIRGELLALHEATTPGAAQWYMNCAQVSVTGKGAAKPKTVAIPGYVSESTPGVVYDVYASPLKLPYPMFGPEPYGGMAPGPMTEIPEDSGDTESGSTDNSSEGEPSDPVPSPTDAGSCWADAQKCWDDAKAACSSSKDANCHAGKAGKCEAMNKVCDAIKVNKLLRRGHRNRN